MIFTRIRKEVTMALIGQHHEFGVRNAPGQNLGRHSMIDFTGHVLIAFADENQGRLLDVLKSLACVMALACKQMAQIEFYRTEIVHSYLSVIFYFLRMLFDVVFGPADENRMVPFVFLIAPFDHLLANF